MKVEKVMVVHKTAILTWNEKGCVQNTQTVASVGRSQRVSQCSLSFHCWSEKWKSEVKHWWEWQSHSPGALFTSPSTRTLFHQFILFMMDHLWEKWREFPNKYCFKSVRLLSHLVFLRNLAGGWRKKSVKAGLSDGVGVEWDRMNICK